jgi:hypothetical protein
MAIMLPHEGRGICSYYAFAGRRGPARSRRMHPRTSLRLEADLGPASRTPPLITARSQRWAPAARARGGPSSTCGRPRSPQRTRQTPRRTETALQRDDPITRADRVSSEVQTLAWDGQRGVTSTRSGTPMAPKPRRNRASHAVFRRKPTGGLEPPTPSLRVMAEGATLAHTSLREPRFRLHLGRESA